MQFFSEWKNHFEDRFKMSPFLSGGFASNQIELEKSKNIVAGLDNGTVIFGYILVLKKITKLSIFKLQLYEGIHSKTFIKILLKSYE